MALIRYWLPIEDPRGPIGFGVTANDVDDAIRIVMGAGFEHFKPLLDGGLAIANIEPLALPSHVRSQVGPLVVRGLWYPLWRPRLATPLATPAVR